MYADDDDAEDDPKWQEGGMEEGDGEGEEPGEEEGDEKEWFDEEGGEEGMMRAAFRDVKPVLECFSLLLSEGAIAIEGSNVL